VLELSVKKHKVHFVPFLWFYFIFYCDKLQIKSNCSEWHYLWRCLSRIRNSTRNFIAFVKTWNEKRHHGKWR